MRHLIILMLAAMPGANAREYAFGPLFGWISFRVRSVWPIALVHWIVGVSLDWFILTS